MDPTDDIKREVVSVIKVLLEHQANPNGVFRLNCSVHTPLHTAVFLGIPEAAEALLTAGANPDVLGNFLELSPLGLALFYAGNRHPSQPFIDVASVLIRRGATKSTPARGLSPEQKAVFLQKAEEQAEQDEAVEVLKELKGRPGMQHVLPIIAEHTY